MGTKRHAVLRKLLILLAMLGVLAAVSTAAVASDEQCRQACQEQYQSELAECQSELAAALAACGDEDGDGDEDAEGADEGDDAADGNDDGEGDDGSYSCRAEAQRTFALCRRDALRNRAACFAACAQSPSSP